MAKKYEKNCTNCQKNNKKNCEKWRKIKKYQKNVKNLPENSDLKKKQLKVAKNKTGENRKKTGENKQKYRITIKICLFIKNGQK